MVFSIDNPIELDDGVLPFIETTEIMKHQPLDVHEEPWVLVAGTDQWMVHLLAYFSLW